MTESDYPEHQKLKAVRPTSQAIGEFLDWLGNVKGISLALQHEHTESCADDGFVRCGYSNGEYMPAHATTRNLLAEFFEIDEVALEAEKRSMLARLRRVSEDDES